MRYLPWPEEGCTLAEARERTADRALWEEWKGRSERGARVDECEQQINGAFREFLRRGRLVANCRRSLAAEPTVTTVIEEDIWPALVNTDWSASAVGENRRGGISFQDVRVFPVVHGTTRIESLAGLSLADAAKRYVLNDPEVVALGIRAIDMDPDLERVFRNGHWSPHGVRQWPLSVNTPLRDRVGCQTASKTDPRLEWAPWAGRFERNELTW